MGVLDKLVNAATTAGRKMVAPDDSTTAGLAAKSRNIEEYSSATRPTVRREDPMMTSPVDRVKPGAMFGSRSGEKRLDTRAMSFKKGTTHVPKTGTYQLHKGEAVVPAKENPMNPYDKVTEGMKKPKKVLHEVRTRKAKSGGYIHEHHHTEPAHHPMEEHTTSDKDAMAAHMMEHMGGEPEAEPNAQSASQAQDAAIGA